MMVNNFSTLQMGEATIILKNVHSSLVSSYCGLGLRKWWHSLDLFRESLGNFSWAQATGFCSSYKFLEMIWWERGSSYGEWSPLEKDQESQILYLLPTHSGAWDQRGWPWGRWAEQSLGFIMYTMGSSGVPRMGLQDAGQSRSQAVAERERKP